MARLKQSDVLGLALAAFCACLLAVGFTLATPSRINAAPSSGAASNTSQENVLRVCAGILCSCLRNQTEGERLRPLQPLNPASIRQSLKASTEQKFDRNDGKQEDGASPYASDSLC